MAMHNALPTIAPPDKELDDLCELSADVLKRARALGAHQAEVGISASVGMNVSVRKGEVETLEHTRDRGLSLTVYIDQRKGSASTADLSAASIRVTLEQAIAIAQHTERDACAGLADADLMAKEFHALDAWHPWLVGAPGSTRELSADDAIELARRCEQAGFDFDPRISNSEGASLASSKHWGVYGNSHGFMGRDYSTQHSISAALLAGTDAMERDYYYDSGLNGNRLQSPEAIGREAAKRTVERLDPRQLDTQSAPVLFTPELARGLFGHLLSAIGGGAQYRKASFLLGAAGTRVLPEWLQLCEYPHLLGGLGSANFDDEGVATRDRMLVENGVLQRYLLGSYSARKLGLQSTANAGGTHNLTANANAADQRELLRTMNRGLLVTELMGQGVNSVTGDYSRGAAGFWIENGEIAYPVSEITIAGNLRDMLSNIVAVGGDVDPRGRMRVGSVLLAPMMIAGGMADE
jgi:PmbA protein